MAKTATVRLASILLDEPFPEWVARQRAHGLSWRKIALALRDATDIDVSENTLRAWATGGGE